MNINYKEAQFEFFPNNSASSDETKRPHYMAARLNLSIENLVIFSIVSIMVVIFTFSLGVERGKRIAVKEAPARVSDSTVAGSSMKTQGAPLDAVPAAEEIKKDTASQVLARARMVEAAVKPETPALKDQVPASPAGGYTVQIASYKNGKRAEREAQSLVKKGYKAFVLAKGQHVVLCVGNFREREEAGLYGKKLKANYRDYVVRRL